MYIHNRGWYLFIPYMHKSTSTHVGRVFFMGTMRRTSQNLKVRTPKAEAVG